MCGHKRAGGAWFFFRAMAFTFYALAAALAAASDTEHTQRPAHSQKTCWTTTLAATIQSPGMTSG